MGSLTRTCPKEERIAITQKKEDSKRVGKREEGDDLFRRGTLLYRGKKHPRPKPLICKK